MPTLKRLAAAVVRTHFPAMALLAAWNTWICWRLFSLDYINQFGSIDGAFVSIARYLSRHWFDHAWWPLWHGGMPFEDTYVPLLHLLVAALATMTGISAAHAYHIAVAAAYALGPVTLYLMAVYLGVPRGGAFAGALIYSLFSPAALLMPSVAKDMAGMWFDRRLYILTVYGEGPHIAALTLLPLVIVALEYCVRTRTGRAFALAVLALAAVFLVNVPGTMAAGLAVFCWIAAQPAGRRRTAWIAAAGGSILAYAVACYGIPPLSELTMLGNIARMHKGFSAAAKITPFLLTLALGAVWGSGHLLSRTRMPLAIRFAALFFALTALLVLSDRKDQFELLPQASRMQLEMEMAVCLLAGALVWAVFSMAHWRLQVPMVLLFAAAAGFQTAHYRQSASREIEPVDLATRSERASALWADAHLAGQRVYVRGSDAFWWNTFTEVPQLIGCCEQDESVPVLAALPYLVDAPTGPYHDILVKAYLQVFGVQAIVVSGPQSTDEYKDIHAPERFEGAMPVLHRELGDTIYAVPQRSASLAHVVRPNEILPPHADEYKVYAFSLVIEDPSRPLADFTWTGDGAAQIRASLRRDDVVAVQVPYFAGWKAWAGGRPIAISADGLGMQVLHPQCEGPCEITMKWTGRPDRLPSAIVSLAALGLVGWLLCCRAATARERAR